jgi:hypothetical protein
MKFFGKLLVAMLCAGAASGPAWADRGWRHPHSSIQFGINVGPVWGYPPYPVYPYPYWPRVYVPPVIVAPSPPPTVYIEQAPPAPAAAMASVPTLEPGYWYYCQESGAYYPHVRQCAGDWHKVPPQQPGR